MTSREDDASRDASLVRYPGGASEVDRVVVEEPLEIRLTGERLLVTMRTPGDDFDLVRGLLYSEGFVESPDDIAGLARCDEAKEDERGNVVSVQLRDGLDPRRLVSQRLQLASAACGVCGKRTLDELKAKAPRVADGPFIAHEILTQLPESLASAQAVFAGTGGLHAAALFDALGHRLELKEDVGRHNAVDKVIGAAMRFGLLPLSNTILLVSGRAGFEIAQKAWRAGIPILASVSAPSSLAIDVCKQGNLTLVGFLRGNRFNVYSGAERIRPA